MCASVLHTCIAWQKGTVRSYAFAVDLTHCPPLPLAAIVAHYLKAFWPLAASCRLVWLRGVRRPRAGERGLVRAQVRGRGDPAALLL